MILAGGQGERLVVLSAQRAKPAVPFGGKYRIIDFALSNCVNSGLYDVAVLTQYRPHLAATTTSAPASRGTSTASTRSACGCSRRTSAAAAADWYQGTADAVYQNLSELRELRAEHTRDPRRATTSTRWTTAPMIDLHDGRKADVTIAAAGGAAGGRAPLRHRHRPIADGRVTGFDEKPAQADEQPGVAWASTSSSATS